MNLPNLHIKRGKILIYRAFAVGNDINLDKAHELLVQNEGALRFQLAKETPDVVIANAPLVTDMAKTSVIVDGQEFVSNVRAKIWEFGAISLCFSVDIPEGIDLDDLVIMGDLLENAEHLNILAHDRIEELCRQINDAIVERKLWDTFEDYAIYYFHEVDGLNGPVVNLMQYDQIYSLILGDSKHTLSNQVKMSISDSYLQYSINDLALIEWNAGLIVDASASTDIPDVLEFAICQLLEMRYYDDALDKELNSLYNEISKGSNNIFSDRFARISRSAGKKYIELSEIVETIQNSLKVVGNFYLAKIFRTVSTRLRLNDWHSSVDNKLNNLAEVSKLLHGEVYEKRSSYLEIIIVILITIEVIPFLWGLAH